MGDEGSGADTPPQQVAEEGRAGQPAMPLEAPGPDRKASDLRNDAAEEERRQKLRQVCSCFHVYILARSVELPMVCFCKIMAPCNQHSNDKAEPGADAHTNVHIGDNVFEIWCVRQPQCICFVVALLPLLSRTMLTDNWLCNT